MSTDQSPITRRLSVVRQRMDVPPSDTSTDISTVRYLASDDTLDRWGTRIVQDWLEGDRIAAYLANPVVAQSHSYGRLAVGTASDLVVEDTEPGVRGLFLTVHFDMEDEDAVKIAGKVARGVMRAGSVGFRSDEEVNLAGLEQDHEWHSERGWMLRSNHLLEFSVGVMVPGNANVLAQRDAPDGWLRDAVTLSAPPDLQAMVREIIEKDDATRKLIADVAGDVVTSAEHAAAIVARNSGPLGFLHRKS